MDEQLQSVTADQSATAEKTAEVDSDTTEQTVPETNEPSEKTQISDSDEGNAEDSSEGATEEQSEEDQKVPYSRFKDVNTRLKEAERKAQAFDQLSQNPDLVKQYFPQAGEQEEQDPVRAEAEKTLREMGYVKADEVERLVTERIKQQEQVSRMADRMLELEKTYDGSDGKPKFVIDDIMDYMQQYGMTDPEKAYKVMFIDELADIRAKEAKKGTPKTESQGKPQQTAGQDTGALIEEAKKTGNWKKVLQAKGLLDSFVPS